MIDFKPLPIGFAPHAMITGKHHCPTCTQQTYLRPVDMSAVLVYALKIIADRSANGAVTTGDDMARYGRTAYCNYTQLKYWGFIIEDRPAGGWRLTADGRAFLEMDMKVPMRLWVFADDVRTGEGIPESWFAEARDIKEYVPKSRASVREELINLEHES